MKKYLLFLLSNLLLSFSVTAQENKEVSTKNDAKNELTVQKQEASAKDDPKRRNFFAGIGVKGEVFVNDNAIHDSKVWSDLTLGGNVFVGKWFSQYVGSRIVVDYGLIKPTFQHGSVVEDEKYMLGRLDLLFDVTNCFRSYSPDRTYNLIPYAGIGGAKAFGAHNRPDYAGSSTSFLFAAGLWNTFRVTDKFLAFLNLGLDFVDSDFDGSKFHRLDGIAAVTIGITVNFTSGEKKQSRNDEKGRKSTTAPQY